MSRDTQRDIGCHIAYGACPHSTPVTRSVPVPCMGIGQGEWRRSRCNTNYLTGGEGTHVAARRAHRSHLAQAARGTRPPVSLATQRAPTGGLLLEQPLLCLPALRRTLHRRRTSLGHAERPLPLRMHRARDASAVKPARQPNGWRVCLQPLHVRDSPCWIDLQIDTMEWQTCRWKECKELAADGRMRRKSMGCRLQVGCQQHAREAWEKHALL